MTATDPTPPPTVDALKPGDVVYVEFAIRPDGCMTPLGRNGDMGEGHYETTAYRWHRTPDPDAAARVAELEAERDAAASAFNDEHEAYQFMQDVMIKLGAEIDALRKVYDAAGALAEAEKALEIANVSTTDLDPLPLADAAHRAAGNVVAAVDAYRAGQKAPENGLSATLADERRGIDREDAEAPRASQAGDYATLCREVAITADRIMKMASTAYSYGANPTHVGDLEVAARYVLALIPDVPPPADARPQPTDAPGRRLSVEAVAEALEQVFFGRAKRTAALQTWETRAEDLAEVLGLRELEDERDLLRIQVAETRATAMRKIAALEAAVRAGDAQLDEARRERDGLRERAERHQRERDVIQAQRDDYERAAVGYLEERVRASRELDALRAGVRRLSERRDLYAPQHWQAAARALLADVPPAQTPDETTNGAPDLMAALRDSLTRAREDRERRAAETTGTKTRAAFAAELEAAESALCDCSRAESPPTNPQTGAVMDHHCDCQAVVAAGVIVGEANTVHVAQCEHDWLTTGAETSEAGER